MGITDQENDSGNKLLFLLIFSILKKWNPWTPISSFLCLNLWLYPCYSLFWSIWQSISDTKTADNKDYLYHSLLSPFFVAWSCKRIIMENKSIFEKKISSEVLPIVLTQTAKSLSQTANDGHTCITLMNRQFTN